jgi:glycosyltransferase involved in cell wall biosynthesis
VRAEKCTTILNYPDLRLFNPDSGSAARADGKFVVLYPGTLNHHQGLDLAIRAFAQVCDRMPGAELHIYGEGPDRPVLARLIEEGNLGDRVRLMPRVPLDQVAPIMASADLGVVPKRGDGFGNEAFSTKILEFMACDVPVIVSRTQIDAYYFDDTVVRFFTPGDEGDLAAALLDEYRNREKRSRVPAARDFAVRYSWQARAIDYQRVIDGLVSERPATPSTLVATPGRVARADKGGSSRI